MSYLRKIEYTVIPEESYRVIRNCPGCKSKTFYCNTHNFRINANGNKVDVWLIYQCEKCRHTLNLTIYERQRPENILPQEYQSFMGNDNELAVQYGLSKGFFIRNKADVDWGNLKYKIVLAEKPQNIKIEDMHFPAGTLIEIENPRGLKLRTDKLISHVLHISRSKVKLLEQAGCIAVETANQSKRINVWIKGEI